MVGELTHTLGETVTPPHEHCAGASRPASAAAVRRTAVAERCVMTEHAKTVLWRGINKLAYFAAWWMSSRILLGTVTPPREHCASASRPASAVAVRRTDVAERCVMTACKYSALEAYQ